MPVPGTKDVFYVFMVDFESLEEKITYFDLIRRLTDSDFVAQSITRSVAKFVTMPLPRNFFPICTSEKLVKTIFKFLGKRLIPWSLLWRTLWANILSKCQTENHHHIYQHLLPSSHQLLSLFFSVTVSYHLSLGQGCE
jgi:hypothetical protein